MTTTMSADTKLIRIYGAIVSIPDQFNIPFNPTNQLQQPDLVATFGALRNPDLLIDIDDIVKVAIKGNRVSVTTDSQLGPRSREHYLIDHAIPNGLSYIGKPVIHAAGLECNGAGILLAGPSGAGKSTTCAYLVSQGWNMLGDDAVGLSIDGKVAMMHASYPSVRMFPDETTNTLLDLSPRPPFEQHGLMAEYGRKTRYICRPDQYLDSSAPAATLVVLGNDEPFSASKLGYAQLSSALAINIFYPKSESTKAVERLDEACNYAEVMNGIVLNFPRTHTGLQQLHEWLTNEMLCNESSKLA